MGAGRAATGCDNVSQDGECWVQFPVGPLKNWKVAYSFCPHSVSLGVHSVSERNEYQGISFGGGWGGGVVRGSGSVGGVVVVWGV